MQRNAWIIPFLLFAVIPFLLFAALYFALCLSVGHCQTRVRQFPDKVILRRGNFIIAATTDGYLCYGTRTPLAASCHKAVTQPWSGQ